MGSPKNNDWSQMCKLLNLCNKWQHWCTAFLGIHRFWNVLCELWSRSPIFDQHPSHIQQSNTMMAVYAGTISQKTQFPMIFTVFIICMLGPFMLFIFVPGLVIGIITGVGKILLFIISCICLIRHIVTCIEKPCSFLYNNNMIIEKTEYAQENLQVCKKRR